MTPRQRLLLAFASGAFFALAAPPTNVYPALWIGAAGYAVSLHEEIPSWDKKRRWLRGALRGILFGAGANIAVEYPAGSGTFVSLCTNPN